MTQSCEVAPTADYVGTWECVADLGMGVPSKIVLTAESNSFQFDWYNYNPALEVYEWMWSGKGTVTVSGSTMTLTFTHLKAFGVSPDWVDSSNEVL